MKNKLPILICFGTRPEWLKVKPLVEIMKDNEYVLLFTGQHPDLLNEVGVDRRIKIIDYENLKPHQTDSGHGLVAVLHRPGGHPGQPARFLWQIMEHGSGGPGHRLQHLPHASPCGQHGGSALVAPDHGAGVHHV